MQEQNNEGTISERPLIGDGCDQGLFFLILQVTGSMFFFANQFHWSRGIVRDELLLHCPTKIAFQVDQGSIDGIRLLMKLFLEVGTITGECWRCDDLWIEVHL
jgi:hypothetical protein